MGRRTSSGRIGAPTFGGLLADAQTITSDDNTDIILDPTGTGRVLIAGNMQIQNQDSLRFGDSDDSNYVAFRGPTAAAGDVTWTLPAADGSSGQALVTDGSGNLSFSTTGATIDDNSVDSSAHYPVLSASTSGSLTNARITSTKLEFTPSSGLLEAGQIQTDSLGVGTAPGISGEIRATNAITSYYSSDETLKENITPINDALNKLHQINGVEYDWTDDYIKSRGGEDGYFVRKHDIGCIAQEVEQILPEIVAQNNEGFKAIKYERIVALLIEAVKELDAKLEKYGELNG